MANSYENYMRRLDQLTSARQNLEQKIAFQTWLKKHGYPQKGV